MSMEKVWIGNFMGPPGPVGPKGDPGSIENLTVAGIAPDARGNIPLNADDVGAVSNTIKINGQPLTQDVNIEIPTVPSITKSTQDLHDGESLLADDAIYLVYEA